MEENDTHTTKVSDSAYSNSCNSQSQRSSGSSKSRHSNSSSSSGYCGHPSTLGSGNEVFPQPPVTKRNKDKEHKKKKLKSSGTTATGTEYRDHHGVDSKTACLSIAIPPGTLDVTTGSECSAATSSVAMGAAGALGVGLAAAMTPGPENGALQKAAFSQTLSCISKLKVKDALSATIPEEVEPVTTAVVTDSQEKEHILNCLKSEQSPQNENEFCSVVSMHDGVVMYTTSSLTDVLGFPKDMWINRSFIDFVHPKDRIAFASHITSGVALPLKDQQNKVSSPSKNSFFCCLRRYRGLKSSGFGVTEKKVTYLPFRLTMTFRELPSMDKSLEGVAEAGAQGIFLVITAALVKPAYAQPDETRVSPKFMTRHLSSCQLSHVDPDVVSHLGYLPQDMLGCSVLDFYHPEDLPFLKEIYEAVMKEQGSPFRSKPYRFRTQNGGYVLLETEWSNFINPWSKKLEFVIGQHRVLKGPPIPDVFAEMKEEDVLQISEEVLKESKIIQEEIQCLLNEVVTRTSDAAKQQVSKRCKDLATFMESLMDEISKPDLKVELPPEEQSFSERDSVMLGEISPHHDYYDSKSSTETPPSYNQLNYNENIQRFFESKPKTTFSDESGESKTEANRSLNSTDEEGKSLPVADSSLGSNNRKCCSPVNGSGSGSGSGVSSESAGMPDSAASRGDTIATKTSHGSYKPPHLTEALLYRHNENMEKRMVQKHREQRSKGGDRESKMKKLSQEKLQEQCHGIKRSGSHSWEGEPFKANKHPHVENLLGTTSTVPGGNTALPGGASIPPLYPGSANFSLWPPFSVTVTPMQTSQPSSTPNGYPTDNMSAPPPHLASMIPVYYIPTGTQQAGLSAQRIVPQEHPGPPPTGPTRMMVTGHQTSYMTQQVPFMNMNAMPGMLYHPMHPIYGAPPMMYPSMAVLQPSTMLPSPMTQTVLLSSSGAMCKQEKTMPEAMSECSKKEKSLFSPGGRTSPNVSPDEDKPKDDDKPKDEPLGGPFSTTRDTECTGDDSSYSSFYSFLKTDMSDESMKSSPLDNLPYPGKAEDMLWEKIENHTSESQERARPILKDPPWLEEVKVTPELMYRYQMDDRTLEDVLQSDLAALRNIHQPLLVNDQLSQLYLDMELEGLSTKLTLDDGITSSSSSGEEIQAVVQPQQSVFNSKKKRHSIEYSKLVMIFEENAPLPPPANN